MSQFITMQEALLREAIFRKPYVWETRFPAEPTPPASNFRYETEQEGNTMNKEQRNITMREALLRDIADLKRERDAAREALREVERENDQLLASNKNYERDWPVLVHERDEAIDARKASAADWLCQVEQANARVSRALQQVALAERERDEARAELSEWQTLRLWGAKPQNIHDFIKDQQVRIHETQDMKTTCEQLERERDEAHSRKGRYAVFVRKSGDWIQESGPFDSYANAQAHARLTRRARPFVEMTRVRRILHNEKAEDAK